MELGRSDCVARLVDDMGRAILVLILYWLLFIVAPSLTVFFLLGLSEKSAGVTFGVFIVLVLIGERGFRPWKRFWKIG